MLIRNVKKKLFVNHLVIKFNVSSTKITTDIIKNTIS